ncbi:hypothetical protein GCM10028784_17210 [Myceligenerans cantabricum]
MIPAHHGALTRTVVSGVLVAVATIASMFALGEVIELGAWSRAGMLGVVLVAACTSLSRWALLNRAMNRALPQRDDGGPDRGPARGPAGDHAAERAAGTASFLATVVGLAVAVWYLLARYGTPSGELTLFVGPDEWRWVLDQFGVAAEIMTTERAPVADTLPIGMVAVAGTLLMFLVADSLAGARMPALAGLPLLVLWTPSLSIMGRIPAGTFVVAVTAALLLLTLDQSASGFTRGGGRESAPVARARRSRAWITAVSSVVVAVLALGTGAGVATIPGVAGGFSQILRTQGQSLELSDEFDMRAGLGARSSEEVLTYEISDDGRRSPLRERAFTAWDGRRVSWDPRDGRLVDIGPETRLMSAAQDVTGGPARLDVTISSSRDGLLPVPLGPRRVVMPPGAERSWRWDPVLDEVRSDGRLTEGTSYTVEMLGRSLSPEALRAAPDGLPTDGEYTSLEPTQHLDRTAEQALEVTEGAGTRYDQALALQNWLHHDGGFTYTPDTAPARTNDATWDFITDRQGYCVQFSTAFFVMARSLGIPTRIGVGYLPGTDDDGDGVWSVTGQDSHSWPEVWFAGHGWVRFEPTPQVQTGPLPDYADPVVASDPAASEVPEDPRPTTNPQTDPDQEESAQAEPTEAAGVAGRSAGGESVSWWVWVGSGLLAAAVCVGGMWLLFRRRKDAPALDPERAWERVVAHLAERDVVLAPSTTLRQAPEAIAEQVRARTGSPLPDETAEGIVTLARAAEDERYAREYVSPSSVRLDELTEQVTAGITETLGVPADNPAARAGKVLTQALRR